MCASLGCVANEHAYKYNNNNRYNNNNNNNNNNNLWPTTCSFSPSLSFAHPTHIDFAQQSNCIHASAWEAWASLHRSCLSFPPLTPVYFILNELHPTTAIGTTHSYASALSQMQR